VRGIVTWRTRKLRKRLPELVPELVIERLRQKLPNHHPPTDEIGVIVQYLTLARLLRKSGTTAPTGRRAVEHRPSRASVSEGETALTVVDVQAIS
jgi:hypothetical protein